MNLIAEGTAETFNNLGQYEVYFNEHDEGELRVYLSRDLSESDITSIQNGLLEQGVVLTDDVRQAHQILSVKFRKEIAPLVIAALVIGGVLIIGTVILGWQLSKWFTGVPWWVLALGAVTVLYIVLEEPAKKAARSAGPYVKKAASVYLLKKAM